MKHYYLAIDLGATTGRTILGALENGKLELEELNRFHTPLIEKDGHSYWDLLEIARCIFEGFKIAADRHLPITSIGIDSWGVDIAMISHNGSIMRKPYAYRDPFFKGAAERFFQRVSANYLYDLTGLQVMDFNTLFQLDTINDAGDRILAEMYKILFIPDAISYMLTGEMVTEYTIASTSHMVNVRTRQFDSEILNMLGLTEEEFGRFVYPGERVGVLKEEVRNITGLGEIPVIAVAGHDTASAVVAVPAPEGGFAYLSSGTWSLLGVETPEPIVNFMTQYLNFSNEGGVEGTTRLLKNICGMWLLERCRANWGEIPYATIVGWAKAAEPFRSFIDPDDPSFANPADMEEAIREFCRETEQPVPETREQIVRCIFDSLAMRYQEVLDGICSLGIHPINAVYVVGGGSRNELLNQFTANATGLTVYAGPAEATAIGNIAIQAIAAGDAANVAEMRGIIRDSMPPVVFEPQDREAWAEAYDRYSIIMVDREDV
jgi:rhamnulokinase